MVSERLMKEKINRLAKGIIDSETPKAELIPPSFEERVSFSGSGRRELSLRSVNGLGIKGLCYSDNPRVRIENAVFLGNKNRIAFRVDPSFLKAGLSYHFLFRSSTKILRFSKLQNVFFDFLRFSLVFIYFTIR